MDIVVASPRGNVLWMLSWHPLGDNVLRMSSWHPLKVSLSSVRVCRVKDIKIFIDIFNGFDVNARKKDLLNLLNLSYLLIPLNFGIT